MQQAVLGWIFFSPQIILISNKVANRESWNIGKHSNTPEESKLSSLIRFCDKLQHFSISPSAVGRPGCQHPWSVLDGHQSTEEQNKNVNFVNHNKRTRAG